ncbi:MAG: CPBP family intramembrane metalloprotease [Xanthomonadales bacterium]|nr:CPBP family intramembrane metalloprotease [Gammaproteobacteria bacterium]NNJ78035.1 CPBP family intramembrane metalloprotease [Xanthomonadales bacterium]NNL04117.1 CPBP family intramembrane metalloprotease [Xanthomonadales bacterium]
MNADRYAARQWMSENRFSCLVEMLLVFGVAGLVILAGLPLAGESLFGRQLVVVAANAVMLALVWLGTRLRGLGAESLGLAVRRAGWKPLAAGFGKSLVVLVLGLIGFGLGSMVMANITGIPQQADVSGYDYLRGNLPMLLISLGTIYVVSSLGEEVIYRGFLIDRLERLLGGARRSTWVAVVISSLVFGAAHFGWGIVGVVQTTFMGLAFALSFIWFRRNLWILVAAHAYMDTALIVPLYLANS